MILIKKIRIRYFRSLKEVTINNINHLNVFSGKNDSGKSNILKALDIFFNDTPIKFDEDYNKKRLEEVRKKIKGKQFIDIRITFNTPKSFTTLPDSFTITKSWDRNGDLLSGGDNLDNLISKGKFSPSKIKIARRSLSTLLRRIKFVYIPGVRDERFFSQLLLELQKALFEREDRRKKTEYSISTTIKSFNEYIAGITKKLNLEFKKTSGIETNLSFPSELTLLFERLLVGTRIENYEIPLYLRGDGIRLWYIPSILNYISEISPKYFIWGFDEPENSCEYSLTKKLAYDFLTKYSKKSQIFVSTHSFSFISIDDSRCSNYRIVKNANLNTKVIEFSKISDERNKLLDELGIIQINNKLKELYDKLEQDLTNIESLKKELEEKGKPFLIFEGETDNIHFELAYNKLFNKKINSTWKLCKHLSNDKGSSIGAGAQKLNDFLYNHVGKIDTDNLIIAVFDFDQEGVNQFLALKVIFDDLTTLFDGKIVFQHKTKKNVFAILLVPPDFRKDFVDINEPMYSYLSTELLYEDSVIPIPNRLYPSKNDNSLYSFKGNKKSFVEKIKTNSHNINFEGFKDTFKLIQDIKIYHHKLANNALNRNLPRGA